jgi:G3E family GTPase
VRGKRGGGGKSRGEIKSDPNHQKRARGNNNSPPPLGLASPKPIIETFVLADPVARCARLDGVVTLVDAAHAMRHLGEVPARTADPSEAVAQVAYADLIILNKTDLVDAAALASLEARVRAINGVAPIVRTQRAAVAVDAVLGVGGFDLDRVAADLEAGAGADGCGDPGHGEPGHVCGGEAGHDHHAHDHAHAHNPAHGEEGHVCGGGACGDDGAHAHSHSHDHAPASPAAPLHDDAVSSVTVSLAGDLDLELVNMWLGALVDVRSEDLYRYKGVLSIAGFPRRYVFQGVHALFTGEAGAPWGEGEARTSRMVFIGRELDAELLREGFGECVVESDGVPKGRTKGAGAGSGAV